MLDYPGNFGTRNGSFFLYVQGGRELSISQTNVISFFILPEDKTNCLVTEKMLELDE